MHGNHIFFNITQNENCCHLWRMCVNTQTETHMCGQIYAYMHVCKYIRVDAAASCQRFVAICYARHSYINMQQQNVFHRLWDEVATVLHATKLFLFLLYHYFIHHMCCIIHNFVDFCVVTVFLLRLLLLLLLLFFSFLLLSLLCAFAPRRIIAIAIASGKCSSLQLRQLAAARVPSDMLFIFATKIKCSFFADSLFHNFSLEFSLAPCDSGALDLAPDARRLICGQHCNASLPLLPPPR